MNPERSVVRELLCVIPKTSFGILPRLSYGEHNFNTSTTFSAVWPVDFVSQTGDCLRKESREANRQETSQSVTCRTPSRESILEHYETGSLASKMIVTFKPVNLYDD